MAGTIRGSIRAASALSKAFASAFGRLTPTADLTASLQLISSMDLSVRQFDCPHCYCPCIFKTTANVRNKILKSNQGDQCLR